VTKRIAEFDGDTDYTSEVKCPWCGNECGDSWEISEGAMQCDDCGREYEVQRNVEVTYSTRKKDEVANG
jgi:DNA-directed RNA polymerase subunit M/transcription elongation factor TFIIS